MGDGAALGLVWGPGAVIKMLSDQNTGWRHHEYKYK